MMNKKTGLTLVTAMAVLVASLSGAVTAAPGSIDSTPTDTTETVYISSGETIQTNFTANDSVDYALPILNATGATADDLATNITVSGDDREYYSFSGTWDSYASGEADTSTDFIHNVSGGELADVPMTANENVTLNVTYWNESAASPTPTTIQVYLENGDERVVREVDSGATFVDAEEVEPPLYRVRAENYNATEVDDSAVSINGSDTSVIYTLAGSDEKTNFEDMTEDLETDGAFTLQKSSLEGDEDEVIPVFLNEKPDWYDMDDFGSYAVYDASADTLTFELAEDNFDGETTMDVSASSDVYRISELGTVLDMSEGNNLGAISQMVM